MRQILILFLFLSFSYLFGIPAFEAEIADTLISKLESHLESDESYYLIASDNDHLDRYLAQKLHAFGVNMYVDKAFASKSIQYSLTGEKSFITKRSLLFNRQFEQEEYFAEAIIIDNSTSKIEVQINFNKGAESPLPDGDITIWKPALISLIAGTLIYSLWSIE